MSNLKVLLLSIYNRNTMLLNYDDIGIASITSFIRKYGYDVKLIGWYEDDINYGAICEYKPDIIGLPVFRDSKDSVFRFSKIIKSMLPNVKISIGGAYATFYAEELLRECTYIDFVTRGEGELVFLDLIKCCENNGDIQEVNGVTYRYNNEIYHNKNGAVIDNLESLPFPSRDMLVDNKLKIATISTSRGCYGKCTFCESPNFWVKNGVQNWRGRSITSRLDEMEDIIEKYGVRRFYIINNSFEDPGSNIKMVENFAGEILERKMQLSYSINVRSILQRKCSAELVEILKASGLCNVFIGVESANNADLRLYGKYANCEDNEKCIELFRKFGIYTSIGFINFNPYSTFEALYANLDFLKKYSYAGFFIMLSRLRIEKGMKIYHKVCEDNLWIGNDYSYKSGLNYRHVDSRIDCLVNFLDKYFAQDEELYNLLYRILYYERYFLMYLAFNKRLVYSLKHTKAEDIIIECENSINSIFQELNIKCSDWFYNLLKISECRWDYKLAYELTNEVLNKQYMGLIDKKLTTIRGKYHKNLIKLGNEYMDYII